MRTRTVVAAGAVALLGAGGLVVVSSGGAEESADGAVASPPGTAPVRRGDLVDRKTVAGTLGYTGEQPILGGVSGTITSIAAEGATVRRGKALYAVDRRPVVLLYGKTPMYRPLAAGVSDGPDVEQLEENLKALGYGAGLTVDDHFSATTTTAVSRWQAAQGEEETGTVQPGQVVFLPDAVRIKDVRTPPGAHARPGGQVLTATGTRRVVTVPLDVSDQQLARPGAKVTVELPGAGTVPGRIDRVGTVATVPSGESDESDEGEGTATISVKITLDDPRKAGRLDQAPVSVGLAGDIRRGVLSVPVEALLALREGGYGVEVVTGGHTRIVPVRAGVFAGGRVEVSGPGLTESVRVGVPGT